MFSLHLSLSPRERDGRRGLGGGIPASPSIKMRARIHHQLLHRSRAGQEYAHSIQIQTSARFRDREGIFLSGTPRHRRGGGGASINFLFQSEFEQSLKYSTNWNIPLLKAQNQVAPKVRMEWWGRVPRGGTQENQMVE